MATFFNTIGRLPFVNSLLGFLQQTENTERVAAAAGDALPQQTTANSQASLQQRSVSPDQGAGPVQQTIQAAAGIVTPELSQQPSAANAAALPSQIAQQVPDGFIRFENQQVPPKDPTVKIFFNAPVTPSIAEARNRISKLIDALPSLDSNGLSKIFLDLHSRFEAITQEQRAELTHFDADDTPLTKEEVQVARQYRDTHFHSGVKMVAISQPPRVPSSPEFSEAADLYRFALMPITECLSNRWGQPLPVNTLQKILRSVLKIDVERRKVIPLAADPLMGRSDWKAYFLMQWQEVDKKLYFTGQLTSVCQLLENPNEKLT